MTKIEQQQIISLKELFVQRFDGMEQKYEEFKKDTLELKKDYLTFKQETSHIFDVNNLPKIKEDIEQLKKDTLITVFFTKHPKIFGVVVLGGFVICIFAGMTYLSTLKKDITELKKNISKELFIPDPPSSITILNR